MIDSGDYIDENQVKHTGACVDSSLTLSISDSGLLKFIKDPSLDSIGTGTRRTSCGFSVEPHLHAGLVRTFRFGLVGGESGTMGGSGERIVESCPPFPGETARWLLSPGTSFSAPSGKDGSSGCVLGTKEGKGEEWLDDSAGMETTLV